MNLNIVILAGNLTRDPDIRYTPKGTAVAQLSLAINDRYKAQDGTVKETVTYVDVEKVAHALEQSGYLDIHDKDEFSSVVSILKAHLRPTSESDELRQYRQCIKSLCAMAGCEERELAGWITAHKASETPRKEG